ncbi:MEDS domain-containing protein [Trujillonella humicola]|uniref:MEDS domain-containing protein n=1 Tax=Trujillonella humicola TaxID=3383699 RepID=UPI003905A1B5
MTAPRRFGSPTGLRPGDHLCWAYDGDAELAAAVLPYLDEGRRRGEHLLLVGQSRPALLDLLEDLPDRDRLLADGRLEVRATQDAYAGADDLSPAAQVERYRAATLAAVGRGRAGLRVAADVTPLARPGAGGLGRLHAYEQLADVLMDAVPMTALCLYDAALGDDVLGPLAVLHPDQHLGRRYPLAHLSGRGPVLSLHGEVDVSQAADVARALHDVAGGAGPDEAPRDVVLDLTDLHFLDVAGARALATTVLELDGRGVRVRLVGARRSTRRVLELFGLGAAPAEDA